LAAHTGGLLIDHAWLRVLGGGATGLPSLAEANGLDEPTPSSTPPPLLEVARARESLGMGPGDFVAWTLSDRVADFYVDLRWKGWEADAAAVPLGHALTCYPPLFSAESRTGSVHRASVPWAEVVPLASQARLKV
jgi:hypothetical protein